MSNSQRKLTASHHEVTIDLRPKIARYEQITSPLPHTIVNTLLAAINTYNIKEFSKLLATDFIYEDRQQPFQQRYQRRPLLEALFYKHNLVFQQLVFGIAKANNTDISKLFIEHCNQVNLPPELFHSWNKHRLQKVNARIDDIKNYGEKIKLKKPCRASKAILLAKNLTTQLTMLPVSKDANLAKVEWLAFKLNFFKVLHEQDPHFKGHLGWKRVFWNLVSLVFSVTLLNCFNYCCTGNFFFFNNTTTQNLVNNLDRTIQPEAFLKSGRLSS